jgi:hypothetical protein
MKKWLTLLFLPIVFVLIGIWLTRIFWPGEDINFTMGGARIVKQAIIPQDVIDDLPGVDVSGKHQSGQSFLGRKIWEPLKRRDVTPERITIYEEKILPSEFNMIIAGFEIKRPDLTIHTYSYIDSTLQTIHAKAKNDAKVTILQNRDPPVLDITESRNFFDMPDLKLGWMNDEGLFLESSVRFWRLHPALRANQLGIRYGGFVHHEF